jgi:three-Cys-motif partner protein
VCRAYYVSEEKANIKELVVDVDDDGLFSPEVGNWADEKHTVVSLYARLFSTGMKNKWHERVYIDLYAGAGFNKVRGSNRVIAGSPIQALLLPDPFDKYIFCEADPGSLDALRQRVRRLAPLAKVRFIEGDCNQGIEKILDEIPAHSANHRVLSLCFVDPYDIGIKFASLQQLSVKFMDFLVLLALYMDAARNEDNYFKEKAVKIDDFLGRRDWRERWRNCQPEGAQFPRFLAEEFSHSMEGLQYRSQPFYKMKKIMFPDNNWPLYRLALFSRDALAYSFWDEVLKYSTNQLFLGGGAWQ